MTRTGRRRERTYGKPSAKDPMDTLQRAGNGPAPIASMWEGLKSLLLALALFLLLRSFVVQNFVITSGSMEETLLVGDFLMMNRLALGSRIPFTQARIPGYSEPHRFDVVVFDPPHENDMKLVKRLIGMPGDTLLMRDRVLHINGEPVDEPWVRHQDVGDEVHPWMTWQLDYLAPGVDPERYRPSRDSWGPLVVPADRYFMLGDNRETSLDSRYWGMLERWRLEGRAVFIYFSYNKDSYRPFAFVREIRWNRFGKGIY